MLIETACAPLHGNNKTVLPGPMTIFSSCFKRAESTLHGEALPAQMPHSGKPLSPISGHNPSGLRLLRRAVLFRQNRDRQGVEALLSVVVSRRIIFSLLQKQFGRAPRPIMDETLLS
jgi:hypothetical protein